MRVKVLLNLGSRDFPNFQKMEGEECDVPDSLGAKLVARNLAEEIVAIVPATQEPQPQDEPELAPAVAENKSSRSSKREK